MEKKWMWKALSQKFLTLITFVILAAVLSSCSDDSNSGSSDQAQNPLPEELTDEQLHQQRVDQIDWTTPSYAGGQNSCMPGYQSRMQSHGPGKCTVRPECKSRRYRFNRSEITDAVDTTCDVSDNGTADVLSGAAPAASIPPQPFEVYRGSVYNGHFLDADLAELKRLKNSANGNEALIAKMMEFYIKDNVNECYVSNAKCFHDYHFFFNPAQAVNVFSSYAPEQKGLLSELKARKAVDEFLSLGDAGIEKFALFRAAYLYYFWGQTPWNSDEDHSGPNLYGLWGANDLDPAAAADSYATLIKNSKTFEAGVQQLLQFDRIYQIVWSPDYLNYKKRSDKTRIDALALVAGLQRDFGGVDVASELAAYSKFARDEDSGLGMAKDTEVEDFVLTLMHQSVDPLIRGLKYQAYAAWFRYYYRDDDGLKMYKFFKDSKDAWNLAIGRADLLARHVRNPDEFEKQERMLRQHRTLMFFKIREQDEDHDLSDLDSAQFQAALREADNGSAWNEFTTKHN